VARRKLTVADYHAMGEAGILTEGELVAMAPIDSDRSGAVNALSRMLVGALGDLGIVAVQNPVVLDDYSESDFVVLRPRADDYRRATPRPEDVRPIVEIANSSLGYDRAVKWSL
jgi:hypothetical protein